VAAIIKDAFGTTVEAYQEVPVKELSPSWPDYRSKFDWVLPDLMIVIEAHGDQHYRSGVFSSAAGGFQRLAQQIAADDAKQVAAEDAGYSYIVINNEITNDDAARMLIDAMKMPESSRRERTKTTAPDYIKRMKEARRRYAQKMRRRVNTPERRKRDAERRREWSKKVRERYRKQQRNS